jgi:hypothetical protein
VYFSSPNTCHMVLCIYVRGGRDGVVDIATRYGLDAPEFESRWGRDFLYPSRPVPRPTQFPIQWVPSLSRGKAAGTLG